MGKKKQPSNNRPNPSHKNLEGQGFHTNPERINKKGRPPLLVAGVIAQLEEEGYTKVSASQIKDAYQLLLNLSETELKEKVTNSTVPMLVRIVAKSMLSGKGFEIIEQMIDRVHGKANQNTKTLVEFTKPVIIDWTGTDPDSTDTKAKGSEENS